MLINELLAIIRSSEGQVGPVKISENEYWAVRYALMDKAQELSPNAVGCHFSGADYPCVYWHLSSIPRSFRIEDLNDRIRVKHFLSFDCNSELAKMDYPHAVEDWPICIAEVTDGEGVEFYINTHPIGQCFWKRDRKD